MALVDITHRLRGLLLAWLTVAYTRGAGNGTESRCAERVCYVKGLEEEW